MPQHLKTISNKEGERSGVHCSGLPRVFCLDAISPKLFFFLTPEAKTINLKEFIFLFGSCKVNVGVNIKLQQDKND